MKTAIHMIATLFIIGFISGGFLSGVSNWADPLIAMNKQKATEEAIFLVQPEGKSYEHIKLKDVEIYKVFDENKKPLGYSLAYEGNGFQGNIRLMIGLSNDINSIVSIEVLEQVETPGLGTKITEDHYKNQYKKLSTVPNLNWVKEGTSPKENEIVAITGATISSKSVVAIINSGLAKLRVLQQGGKL